MPGGKVVVVSFVVVSHYFFPGSGSPTLILNRPARPANHIGRLPESVLGLETGECDRSTARR